MISIVAIDPGPKESAYVQWDGKQILDFGNIPNDEIIGRMESWARVDFADLWMEGMQSYGTIMGASTIETLIWIGRFYQEWVHLRASPATLALRTKIKTHICGNAAAKDGHVREALIARIGPPGKKSSKGHTYGISSHAWQALGLAVYAYDKTYGD